MIRMMFAAAVASATAAGASAQLSYQFDLTAFYQFGAPSDLVAGPAGGPDTGFLRVANSGATTFVGTISLFGITPSNVTYSTTYSTGAGGWGTGAAGSLSINSESSNVGGFNIDPSNPGGPQLGILISINGFITDGSTQAAISLSVYDSQIHSGVFRTNPYGLSLDNYILQGGDAFGRDTGDDYEVTQAPGSYQFAGTIQTVPLPTAAASGFLGLAVVASRRRR